MRNRPHAQSPQFSRMAKKQHGRRKFTDRGGPEGGPSQRRLRVGEELRHALVKIFQEGDCRDPVLEGASITVSEVRMSPDLRNAIAYILPLAGTNAAAILAALGRGASFLKARVAREVQLRYAPNLVFALDHSFDNADRISALLARPEVARDLQPQPASPEDRDDA
ncbi:MAG: 30S ribosome-binding factor RbfA [Stellaceae bacterium]